MVQVKDADAGHVCFECSKPAIWIVTYSTKIENEFSRCCGMHINTTLQFALKMARKVYAR